ncbi:MAG: hypothetical protein COB49_12975 [Alphaproteobacteria bacterium]|nr:MAG: hypothetical protein COB49_12975 [Alphaproteobacteria bacterium]
MRGIVYIHVPKCGGSSFGAALRARYFYSQATIDLARSAAAVAELTLELTPGITGAARILADYDQRRRDLQRLMASGVRCISGHVRYDAGLRGTGQTTGQTTGSAPDYAFITLLRDPVDRFVSHYHYLQRRHPDPTRPNSLAGFLTCKDAPRIASQYLFYFGGQQQDQNQSADQNRAIDTAKLALAQFDLVGDLSNPAAFTKGLRHLTGGLVPWVHRNRAPSPTLVPPELRAQITALCAADIAIYRATQAKMAA